MGSPGSDPDIDGIIAQTEILLSSGANVEAAVSGLKKIIARLQKTASFPEDKLRRLREFVKRIESANRKKDS